MQMVAEKKGVIANKSAPPKKGSEKNFAPAKNVRTRKLGRSHLKKIEKG